MLIEVVVCQMPSVPRARTKGKLRFEPGAAGAKRDQAWSFLDIAPIE